MKKALLIILVVFYSCIDKYDFNVYKKDRGLVVEASISDISFMETLHFPSDGRHFKAVLTETNDVDNIRDKKVSDASIMLRTKGGNEFAYTAELKEPGTYYLREDFFKAEAGDEYQMEIVLKDGQMFLSNWEKVPDGTNSMGDIDYQENIVENYVFEAGEKVIRPITGIDVQITVPEENFSGNQFYRWTFDPLWTYSAAMLPVDSPLKNCWVTSDFYLKDFVLAKIHKGGFDQKLFFLTTRGNWRLYVYFSTLIHQEKLSPGFYQFWKDLQSQRDKGGLYDQPPFGLATNFTNVNGSWTVNGYFGVVDETTVRWTFNPEKLSYAIVNDLEPFCRENGDPDFRIQPRDQCYDCRSHTLGDAVNYPPLWWTK